MLQIPKLKISRFIKSQVEEGIFVGPDIYKFIKDKGLKTSMPSKVKEAEIAFKDTISKFFGDHKDSNYKLITKNILEEFQVLHSP